MNVTSLKPRVVRLGISFRGAEPTDWETREQAVLKALSDGPKTRPEIDRICRMGRAVSYVTLDRLARRGAVFKMGGKKDAKWSKVMGRNAKSRPDR